MIWRQSFIFDFLLHTQCDSRPPVEEGLGEGSGGGSGDWVGMGTRTKNADIEGYRSRSVMDLDVLRL